MIQISNFTNKNINQYFQIIRIKIRRRSNQHIDLVLHVYEILVQILVTSDICKTIQLTRDKYFQLQKDGKLEAKSVLDLVGMVKKDGETGELQTTKGLQETLALQAKANEENHKVFAIRITTNIGRQTHHTESINTLSSSITLQKAITTNAIDSHHYTLSDINKRTKHTS